jgi:hypothetical protein
MADLTQVGLLAVVLPARSMLPVFDLTRAGKIMYDALICNNIITYKALQDSRVGLHLKRLVGRCKRVLCTMSK